MPGPAWHDEEGDLPRAALFFSLPPSKCDLLLLVQASAKV